MAGQDQMPSAETVGACIADDKDEGDMNIGHVEASEMDEPESEPLLPRHRNVGARDASERPSPRDGTQSGGGVDLLMSARYTSDSPKGVRQYLAGLPWATVMWLAELRAQYGVKLLLLLFAAQHVLKGIVHQFQASSMMWIFRDYNVSGPRMQVYWGLASSSWALKPIIGLISDIFPVFGFHKAPYILFSSVIGIYCTYTIGTNTTSTMSVLATVFCLFGMSLQASTCDLLTEAKYSEHLQVKPAFGPDLLTYIWGGISLGNIITIVSCGFLITYFGARCVYLACIVPSAVILLPTLLNYFEERQCTPEHLALVREGFRKQKEVVFLCVLMFFLTTSLSICGAATSSHTVHFIAALVVVIILIPSFHITLRSEIAKVNLFFILQGALSFSIHGATFYFYTDTAEQYPDGPHFSVWFFTTTLGLLSSAMSIVGLMTYSRYMKDWTYRSLLLFTNLVMTVLQLLDVMMFKRLNLKMGIPDTLFILGSSTSMVVIRQWQWMPAVVLMSQLCPTGMEATMFALLAGCANLGNQLADYFGAFMLDCFDVHPNGMPNEGHQFDNLWKASLISTQLPAITIAMIPWLIPHAKQTDRLLLSNPSSATVGSPYSLYLQRNSGIPLGEEDEDQNTPRTRRVPRVGGRAAGV